MRIIKKYVLPDGTIADTLPPEYKEQFGRRLTEALLPLAYDAVMDDLRRETEKEQEAK